MATIYKNIRKKDIKNAQPGYAANAWITPLDYINTFAGVVGNAAAGDSVTIDDSHVYATNKGSIAVYVVPKTTQGDGEMVGDPLARRYAWKPKIIIPGDSPELYEMVLNLLNEDFILHVKDAKCETTQFIQFGCDCDPCQVDTAPFTGGTVGSGRKQYELNLLTYCKFFYNGVITELDDEA
jgi:hypothetical protein